MTWLLVAYLAGVLGALVVAGYLDVEEGNAAFVCLFWPFVLPVVACLAVLVPFYRFGTRLRRWDGPR